MELKGAAEIEEKDEDNVRSLEAEKKKLVLMRASVEREDPSAKVMLLISSLSFFFVFFLVGYIVRMINYTFSQAHKLLLTHRN